MTRRLLTTPTRPPARALRPARTSAPIPSLAQVASALALGALGAAGSVMPAAAAPPPDAKAGPDGGAPVVKEETGDRDGGAITITPGSTVAPVVPSTETSYPPFAGVPPPTIHHGGMCACDLPGPGTDPAPLEALGAAALVALAACRARRRKGDPAG